MTAGLLVREARIAARTRRPLHMARGHPPHPPRKVSTSLAMTRSRTNRQAGILVGPLVTDGQEVLRQHGHLQVGLAELLAAGPCRHTHSPASLLEAEAPTQTPISSEAHLLAGESQGGLAATKASNVLMPEQAVGTPTTDCNEIPLARHPQPLRQKCSRAMPASKRKTCLQVCGLLQRAGLRIQSRDLRVLPGQQAIQRGEHGAALLDHGLLGRLSRRPQQPLRESLRVRRHAVRAKGRRSERNRENRRSLTNAMLRLTTAGRAGRRFASLLESTALPLSTATR